MLNCCHASCTGAGWFCDKVVVREATNTESQLIYFPCGQWLDLGKSDGLIERTLLPQQPPDPVQEPHEPVEEEPRTKPSTFNKYLVAVALTVLVKRQEGPSHEKIPFQYLFCNR